MNGMLPHGFGSAAGPFLVISLTVKEKTLEESFRFLDWGVVKLSDKVELGYSAIYQVGSTNGKGVAEEDPERLSLVLRPVYKWSNYMSTVVEIGYDDVTQPWMNDSLHCHAKHNGGISMF